MSANQTNADPIYADDYDFRSAPLCYCEDFEDDATCSFCIATLSGEFVADVMEMPAGGGDYEAASYSLVEEELSAIVGMRVVDSIPTTRTQALAW